MNSSYGWPQLLAETDVLPDTRVQWALEVARDFDVPALDFVLRRLAEHPPSELAEMARSFHKSCTRCLACPLLRWLISTEMARSI